MILQNLMASLGTRDLKPNQFWDAIVISASDESQIKGYKMQISSKQSRKEMPLTVPFHIFADPPGYKIGNNHDLKFIYIKCN